MYAGPYSIFCSCENIFEFILGILFYSNVRIIILNGNVMTNSTIYWYILGTLSCGITHTFVTPLDLVKCRIQVDPKKYVGVFNGFKVTLAEDGPKALVRGWAPTFIGYSIQGFGKFGFYELFKVIRYWYSFSCIHSLYDLRGKRYLTKWHEKYYLDRERNAPLTEFLRKLVYLFSINNNRVEWKLKKTQPKRSYKNLFFILRIFHFILYSLTDTLQWNNWRGKYIYLSNLAIFDGKRISWSSCRHWFGSNGSC